MAWLRKNWNRLTGRNGKASPAPQKTTLIIHHAHEWAPVRYAGPESDADTPSGSFEFGFEMDVGGESVCLPAITSNPAVIEALREMVPGDRFIISHEGSWGGMGTRVDGIMIPIGGDAPSAKTAPAPAETPKAVETETAQDMQPLRPANIRKRAARSPA